MAVTLPSEIIDFKETLENLRQTYARDHLGALENLSAELAKSFREQRGREWNR